MRLCAIQATALRACLGGTLPDMPRSLDLLCDAGLIDNEGAVTDAGKAAWASHVQSLEDDAIQRNIIPSVFPAEMVALGRLMDGEAPRPGDQRELERHETLAEWREGSWELTALGRRVVELSRLTVE